MDLILVAVISLGAIGLISAVILYAASKKFAVYEDPRIGQVAEVLPQANCGGCGYPGCSGFAAACVKAGSLEGKLCPVGGQPTMEKVAAILGLELRLQNRKWLLSDVTVRVPTVRASRLTTAFVPAPLRMPLMVVKRAVRLAVWDAVTV